MHGNNNPLPGTPPDPGDVRLRFLELLCYLSSSAHGAVSSSKLYGPMRLMEAAERVIELMDVLGLADDELRALARDVVANAMLIGTDEVTCREFTDGATMSVARMLKQASRTAE